MTEDKFPQSALRVDKPVGCQKDDLYDRAAYVQNLATALREFNSPEGLIIGIHGPWGSGKTSLKNMLIEQLKSSHSSKPIPVVQFDPWVYSGSGRLVSLMFKQISLAFSGKAGRIKHRFAAISKKIETYASDVSEIGNTALPGSGAYLKVTATAFKEVGEALEPDGHDIDKLSERLVKLRKQLEKSPTRIIVFIDDLDRLMDDEVVEMLRAVKAVGDLPNVTYVLLYDRDTITKALDTSCHNKGTEYLEKIIQVPIGLPKPPDEAVQKQLKKELSKIAGEETHTIYGTDIPASSKFKRNIYDTCVLPFIRNIRDVIRLSNEFGLRYQVLQDDVEGMDLLGITTLEVFRPSLHRWIMGNKDLLCSPNKNQVINEMSKVRDRAHKLKAHLDKFISENKETAELEEKDRAAVQSMFPLLCCSEKDIMPDTTLSYQSAYREICNPKHFDTYFRLSIDQNLLHESQFKQFLFWDSLDEHNLDENHWKILTDPVFPEKAAKYFSEYDTARAAKIVGFCLDLESKFGPSEDEYRSLRAAASIMNAPAQVRERAEYTDAVLRAVIESGTVVSMPVAAYLADAVRNEIHAHKGTSTPLQFYSSSLNRYISTDSIKESKEMRAHEKRWLQQLCDHLKAPQGKKQGKLPSAAIIRNYANKIPSLYYTYNDKYAAFKTLLQVIPDDKSVLYVAEALTNSTQDTYSMELPLLHKLGITKAYKSAVEKWKTDANFRDSTKLDLEHLEFAAFYATIRNGKLTNSVSHKEVKDIIGKTVTEEIRN